VGPNNAPVLDTVSGNIGYYARTAAEIAVSLSRRIIRMHQGMYCVMALI